MANKFRQFGKRSYHFLATERTQGRAHGVAKDVKNMGHRVRVVKLQKRVGPRRDKYAVYMRRGKRG